MVGWRRDTAWWAHLADRDRLDESVVALEPGSAPMIATDARLDATAYAFAAVIDAKTPFTYRHSTNVARYAVGIASALGADTVVSRDMLRAGLLHDIGKLGVSNRILDKPGRLTEEERDEVKKHPRWTLQILERVPAFRHFAAASAHHHERLDGRGYPWGLDDQRLDFTARVLAIADVYEALTANRPYREGLSLEKVLGIMGPERGTAFDAELLDVAVGLAECGTLAGLAAENGDPLDVLQSTPPALPVPAASVAA
jgi:putative nucleotidyltransferase with HDIG domain